MGDFWPPPCTMNMILLLYFFFFRGHTLYYKSEDPLFYTLSAKLNLILTAKIINLASPRLILLLQYCFCKNYFFLRWGINYGFSYNLLLDPYFTPLSLIDFCEDSKLFLKYLLDWVSYIHGMLWGDIWKGWLSFTVSVRGFIFLRLYHKSKWKRAFTVTHTINPKKNTLIFEFFLVAAVFGFGYIVFWLNGVPILGFYDSLCMCISSAPCFDISLVFFCLLKDSLYSRSCFYVL